MAILHRKQGLLCDKFISLRCLWFGKAVLFIYYKIPGFDKTRGEKKLLKSFREKDTMMDFRIFVFSQYIVYNINDVCLKYEEKVSANASNMDWSYFYAPVSKDRGGYCFTFVRLSLRPSVCLSAQI